jgi:hypothetical protein
MMSSLLLVADNNDVPEGKRESGTVRRHFVRLEHSFIQLFFITTAI